MTVSLALASEEVETLRNELSNLQEELWQVRQDLDADERYVRELEALYLEMNDCRMALVWLVVHLAGNGGNESEVMADERLYCERHLASHKAFEEANPNRDWDEKLRNAIRKWSKGG